MYRQISIFDSGEKFKITKPIRLIELFAGIGSQAKALKNIGVNFEHYRICEYDKYAVQSYNAVHGTNFETSDITKIHSDNLAVVDTDKYIYIMTYSFPCTDLSLAGKQMGMKKGSGTRSGLLWEVERLLDEMQELPQVLLMENVPQVICKSNIADFQDWLKKLESFGYKNYYKFLNAKDFEIPQNRNRCFMVSVLGNYDFEFPKVLPLSISLNDILEDKVSDNFYLSDKMKKYIVAKKDKWSGNKNGAFVNKKIASTITTCEGNHRCDTSNYICSELPDNFDLLKIDCLQDYRIRKLTPKECWRLMGFDDFDFVNAKKVCSNRQLYKQAGNSIVVNVLMSIFAEMF